MDRAFLFQKRLTKEENRMIEAAAKATEHKNKSRWIREALLRAARAEPAPEPEHPAISQKA